MREGFGKAGEARLGMVRRDQARRSKAGWGQGRLGMVGLDRAR